MSTVLVKITADLRFQTLFHLVPTWLEHRGWTYANPQTGDVYTWTGTGDGRIVTDVDSVKGALLQGQPGNVQMWNKCGTDVHIHWSKTEMSVYLDGLTNDEKMNVIGAIVAGYVSTQSKAGLSWVIRLGTEDYVCVEEK